MDADIDRCSHELAAENTLIPNRRFSHALLRSLHTVKACTERRNWTELNWHGLVFDELTNGQEGQTHWSLVDAYIRVVT